MKLRWIMALLLLSAIGIAGTLIVSCTLSGDVVLTSRDSFRMLSPDLEVRPKVCTETTIDNDDDDDPDKEEK